MTTEATNVQGLMKACQRGVAGKGPAIESANNLLAECYGALGKLAAENEALRKNADRYLWLREHHWLCEKDVDRKIAVWNDSREERK